MGRERINLPTTFLSFDGAGYRICTIYDTSRSAALQREGKRIEREGAEKVPAHSRLDLSQLGGGLLDPIEGNAGCQLQQFRLNVSVAQQIFAARLQKQQIFE